MDWQRIIEVGIVASCMMFSLMSHRLPAQTDSGVIVAWGTFFLLGLASSIWIAEHTTFALLEWSWMLLIVSLSILLRREGAIDHEKLDRWVLLTVLIASIAYSWWFWRINAFIYFDPLPEGVTRIVSFPGFANIRFFSDYQSLMLLLLPTAFYRLVPAGLIRSACTWLVGLYFTLALIVASRSLVASHLLMHAILLAYLGKHYRPFLMLQLRFWIYGGIFLLILSWILPALIHSGAGHTLTGTDSLTGINGLIRSDSSKRLLLWQSAWEMIEEHPWLGVGPWHFANKPNPIAAGPHNFPLQIATEWGVPAAILLIWLIGHQIYFRLRQVKRTSAEEINQVSLAMAGATIAVSLQAMFASSPMNYPVSQVAALICFAYPVVRRTTTTSEDSCHSKYIIWGAGGASIIIVICTLTSLTSIQKRNDCFHHNQWPTTEYAPRFWQQGWLVGPCGPGESLLSKSGGITPSPQPAPLRQEPTT